MNLIDILKNEHRVIEKHLVQLDKFSDSLKNNKPTNYVELKQLVSFLEFYVGKLHHDKEEKLLFPLIGRNPKINHGGPNCSFNMGMWIQNNLVGKIKEKTKNYASFDLDSSLSPEMKLLVAESNPLSIPIEEHIAGHLLIDSMKYLIEQIQHHAHSNTQKLAELLDLYAELLKQHINKEDTCLFEMVKNLLTPNELETLAERSREYDRKLKDNEPEHFLYFSGLTAD